MPNGPDNHPFPGSQGGLEIPDPPALETPGLGGFQGFGDEAKKDMDAHKDQKTGTIKKDGLTITWKRTDETHWSYTVEISNPNGPVTLQFDVTIDGTGLSHTRVTLPPKPPPGVPRHFGPTYMFLAAVAGCAKLISVVYVQRTDTLFDSAGKTIQTSRLGPGIDGGVPYPVQGPIGGNQLIQDSPGFDIPAGQTDQQFAQDEIAATRGRLNVDKDKAGVKATFEYKYWVYLICLDKYDIVGHWEYSFTLVVEPGAKPPLSQTGVQEPTWTAGK